MEYNIYNTKQRDNILHMGGRTVYSSEAKHDKEMSKAELFSDIYKNVLHYKESKDPTSKKALR